MRKEWIEEKQCQSCGKHSDMFAYRCPRCYEIFPEMVGQDPAELNQRRLEAGNAERQRDMERARDESGMDAQRQMIGIGETK